MHGQGSGCALPDSRPPAWDLYLFELTAGVVRLLIHADDASSTRSSRGDSDLDIREIPCPRRDLSTDPPLGTPIGLRRWELDRATTDDGPEDGGSPVEA
jgi:hypothetical protein